MRLKPEVRWILAALAVPALCLCLMVGVYFLPPVYSRLSWRVDEALLWVQYRLNPPAEQVFVPQAAAPKLEPLVTVIGAAAGPEAGAPAATPAGAIAAPVTPGVNATSAQPAPTALPSAVLPATATPALPTPTATPLPPANQLEGVVYEDQHGRWNYCAPANLSMALSYWGWLGNRDVVGPVLKPMEKDKNVMPYEMVDYITYQTQLRVAYRVGGDLDLMRRSLAAGFPLLVEKGVYLHDLTGVLSWMGHYQVVTGYDDASQMFTTQDSFLKANLQVSYDEMLTGWRAFNYTYLLIYPAEREAEVLALLGPDADPRANAERAAQKALDEQPGLAGMARYFARFNLGSSQIRLAQLSETVPEGGDAARAQAEAAGYYTQAAQAYDEAFRLYSALPEDDRPWRMLWYQTGPYYAYYFTGRYQEVIDLATLTLKSVQGDRNLEESYYWRARARVALGDKAGAVEDLQLALKYHPGFGPALLLYQEMN